LFVVSAILHTLQLSVFMLWEVLWPLAFGFLLSAMVQTVVSKRAVAGALGRPDLKGFVLACGLGAASSSCSYAAVAVARALFRRGASFVNAIIFEFASTNMVFELGLVLLILLGWQFVAAEFAGGLLMALLLWIVFKVTLRQRMVDAARRQAERGVFGSTHEAHGEMDMSITDGPFLSRAFLPRAFTAISHSFFMDLNALYLDLGLGFLIAGALAAWVPNSWWQALFLTDQPTLNEFWSPLIGPVISMLSFVCSVGNVPLAAVLWNGGISFGGVISFIFADLIILPILNIYRKYYGGRMSLYLLAVSYGAMALPAPGTGPDQSPPHRLRNPADLELHHVSGYRVSSADGSVGLALRHYRRNRNAAGTRPSASAGCTVGPRPGVRDEHRSGLRHPTGRIRRCYLLLLLGRLSLGLRGRSIQVRGSGSGAGRSNNARRKSGLLRPRRRYGKHWDGDGFGLRHDGEHANGRISLVSRR